MELTVKDLKPLNFLGRDPNFRNHCSNLTIDNQIWCWYLSHLSKINNDIYSNRFCILLYLSIIPMFYYSYFIIPMFFRLMTAGFGLVGHRVFRAAASLPSSAVAPAPIKCCTLGDSACIGHELSRDRRVWHRQVSHRFVFCWFKLTFVYCVFDLPGTLLVSCWLFMWHIFILLVSFS